VDGQIQVTKTQEVTFFLTSDNGSRLYIDNALVIDHGGLHGFLMKPGSRVLTQGTHNIRVEYFENTGYAGIQLEYQVTGGPRQLLTVADPNDWYWLNLGTTGAAVVYSLSSGTWIQDRLLMPETMPEQTSWWERDYPTNYATASLRQYDGGTWYDYGVGYQGLGWLAKTAWP